MTVYQQQWLISVARCVLFAVGVALISGGAGYLIGVGRSAWAAFAIVLFVAVMAGFAIGLVGPWPTGE